MTACCQFCREPIDPTDRSVWRAIRGWERKGFGESRRGGSDIVLRENTGELACALCVTRLQQGLSVAQEQLC